MTLAEIQAMGVGASFYSLAVNSTGRANADVTYRRWSAYSFRTIGACGPNITLSPAYVMRRRITWAITRILRRDWASPGESARRARTPRQKWCCAVAMGIFYDRFTEDLILAQQLQNGVIQQQYLVQNPGFLRSQPDGLPSGFGGSSRRPADGLPTESESSHAVHDANGSEPRAPAHKVRQCRGYLSQFARRPRVLHQFHQRQRRRARCHRDEILYQYQSEGVFKQNQFIVNSSVRMGTKLTAVRLLRPELCEQRYFRPDLHAFRSTRSVSGLWPRVV